MMHVTATIARVSSELPDGEPGHTVTLRFRPASHLPEIEETYLVDEPFPGEVGQVAVVEIHQRRVVRVKGVVTMPAQD
ncbi:hypothetical protein [Jiangella alkaliphila]|uniref:Uncharacterized protein n=1 Tax=Jiangella alkaliphila TaxID=419479 RepID=A0A1H2L7R6_9ACTN|nr:hypothetical protein [Jiangella alkaliphila]SDU76969.1 hypothetical protein SAMN04488563_5375 [Jiangella alkaliphila]